MLIDRDDLRDNIEQQRGDYRHGDHRDQRRIDQRRGEFRAQRLARLEIIGEAREDFAKLTSLATDRDEATIELRERAREARQCCRQRLSGADLFANRVEHARSNRMVRLFCDRSEGLVERHARCDKRRKLSSRE